MRVRDFSYDFLNLISGGRQFCELPLFREGYSFLCDGVRPVSEQGRVILVEDG